ncbi:MAG: hypothetical protein H8E35_16170 [Ardenticatenia bacterium]|nr:hypothetical protein [Ardenticatenia bacterium]
MVQLDIDHNEIERRKQFYRDVFDYRPVDHVPVFIWMMGFEGSSGYTLREELESTEIQFQINVETIRKSLELIPDDYIPTVRVTQGYMTIATMFGMETYWSDDPNQPPGTGGHIISDLEHVYSLRRPTMDDGIMPENIRRLRYHAENLPPDVHLTGIDNGGPLNNLKDLLETDLLYTGFYDNPEAMHYLLDMVTDVQLELCHTLVETVGDINRFAGIDFDPLWHPEKYKSFCSDDVCATIGPDLFQEFSIPYNDRIYQPWGCGGFHNCGPNPCKHLYLAHDPKMKYLNCSYRYSHQEFSEFREIFAGWGLVEPMFDNGETAEEMLAGYRYTMESLAPDTLAIPYCIVDSTWSDSDITGFYWDMRKIAEEYASNMKWATHQVNG